MTIEQVELRKILKQMLADNGINRETIKDFIKECIDERVDKALKNLESQSNGNFANIDDKIQSAIDRLVKQEIEKQAKETIRYKVSHIFSSIFVDVQLNHPTEKGGADNEKTIL